MESCKLSEHAPSANKISCIYLNPEKFIEILIELPIKPNTQNNTMARIILNTL